MIASGKNGLMKCIVHGMSSREIRLRRMGMMKMRAMKEGIPEVLHHRHLPAHKHG